MVNRTVPSQIRAAIENPQPAIRNPHSAVRNPPEVSIIIVNYNSWPCLRNCLQSIQTHAGDLAYEIIVADNASTDQSAENLAREFPQVRRIENSANFGFSRACNQGIQVATGTCILLLNPDTCFVSGMLSDAVHYLLVHPDIGILGAKVLNEDGSLQPACRRSIPTMRSAFFRFVGLSRLFPRSSTFGAYNLTHADENQTADVGAVSGAFLMFPRQLIEKTGGLDERFFIYGEDLDFCLRAAKVGKRVIYWPRVVIEHLKGQSIKSRRYASLFHFYNAMWLFYRKHYYSQHSLWENCATYVGIWVLGLSRFLLNVLTAPFSRK